MNASTHFRRRRQLIGAASALLAMPLMPARAVAAASRKTLVLAGPQASVSFPFLHMIDSGALADVADKVEFRVWSNPDQLRALAIEGTADFIAAPSNVAANLYNRGVPVKLLNISVWGMLWLVSRNPDFKTLADFKGQEIAMPFRADMPDILFSLLSQGQGLDPAKDFRLRYVASPMDAMQLLITRRVDHALLAEPAVSMALRKTQSFPVSIIAPDLYRSVSLQDEWGRVLQREPRIPQAGIVALGQARQDAELLDKVQQAYAASQRWCYENPDDCGKLAASHIEMFIPEAVADAMRVSIPHYATASEARPELEYFYQALLDRQPGLVGGKLPDDGFYA
ncbi:ABC transporter substrate-binding protein [Paracandidimonas soli]|uniref:ABC transporter substrate-binding protein n=1 Tax=Paracandidimonas soli TaxID=1917182 RepID=UPI00334233EC